MEDDQNKFKWKTTKQIHNGRRQKKSKWKMTKKFKMEDDHKFQQETTT